MAFKNASILAFRNAYKECAPIILEPYDKITVNVPNEYLGSILSDLTKRRARILETNDASGDTLDIICLAPESEIMEYANELKSLSKATAYFNLEFNSYEPLPKNLEEKVIEENR